MQTRFHPAQVGKFVPIMNYVHVPITLRAFTLCVLLTRVPMYTYVLTKSKSNINELSLILINRSPTSRVVLYPYWVYSITFVGETKKNSKNYNTT